MALKMHIVVIRKAKQPVCPRFYEQGRKQLARTMHVSMQHIELLVATQFHSDY